MPELPEVETIVNQLNHLLPGRRIASTWIGWERIVDRPAVGEFCQRLTGQVFASASRRGKFLLFALCSSDTLIVHLRMTGSLQVHPAACAPDKHTHAVMMMDNGQALHYRDPRKFGRLYLVDEPAEVVGRLGPEPLANDFDVATLACELGGRRARVKSLLLDQRVVAGLGNIYADEALFRAGIHPLRLGSSLTPGELARLRDGICSVLKQAVEAGGSTLRDYRSVGGQVGGFQERLEVFRQNGKPCPVCGAQLERIRVGGRSTHFCPHCQPPQGIRVQDKD
jgi:formamidopyrimidine-DNA glycosylase